MVISEREAVAALQAGRPAPVYLLLGDDQGGRKRLLDQFPVLVPEDVRGFNVEQFYADEADPLDIVVASRTLPFVSPLRLVIVLRAEALFTSRRGGESEGEGADQSGAPQTGPLAAYFDAPVPSSVLVFAAADVNRTLKLTKALLACAQVVEFWGLKSERDAKGRGLGDALQRGTQVARESLREAGLTATSEAVAALVEHAGTDVETLRNALELVRMYCAGRSRVTADDVAAVVRGAAPVDDWALVRAIEDRDAPTALRQLRTMLDNGSRDTPFQVLGQLGWFVRSKLPQLAPARVPAAVDAVFRTDLAFKSSGGDQDVLLERLVVELCGGVGRRAPEMGTSRRR